MDSAPHRAQTESGGGIRGTGRRSRAPKHAVPTPTKHKLSTVPGFPSRTGFYWNSAQGLELLSNGIGNGKRTNPRFLPLLSPSAARPSAGWSQMTWRRRGGNLSIWKGN